MISYENIIIQVHRKILLNDVSLRILNGEKLVIHGPSGCGKSSLLKSAVGALPFVSGSIHVDQLKLTAQTVSKIRGRIAFIGQEPLLGAEHVRDALLLPFTFKAHREHKPTNEQIEQLLERLHLSADLLDKPCNRISGGEKQRIAILRALLLNKTIFLADEVTSALDPASRTAVMTELFRPEITLLSVSHDSEWIDACDRVLNISTGRLKEVLS
jgi:putative ABC transport system ATP-binding protein